ncbi:MAG: sugar phosphate isomerase/epimerase [Verrucomicrobia bacterium]|nr:sugar phosphate isomerase/epimerase [Verrucomicrobiota bacterium]
MDFTRRDFLKLSGSSLAFATLGQTTFAEEKKEKEKVVFKRDLKKAIMFATVGFPGSVSEKFKAIKEAGFSGIEPMSHMDSDEVLKARDVYKLELPSVCCGTHWKENLASPNPSERDRGVEGLKHALRDASKYGSTSVLLVPCVVTKDISYADAWARSQAEIRKAIPLAEKLGIYIAIENVWNNFLLSPLEMARYVDDFKSPIVGVHFDIGNIYRYGWPEHWISILGRRILKIHLKEFSVEKMNKEGLRNGFQVEYLEGSNNWPTIMRALDEIGYTGWAIAEPAYANPATDEAGLKNISERMDKIFAS